MIRVSVLFFLSLLLIFPSCKKNDPVGPTTFSATINGTIYSTTNVTESGYSGVYDFIANDNSNTMSLYLTDVVVATYSFTTSNSNPGIGYVSNGKTYANGISPTHKFSSGAIIITTNDNNAISGTFSGTLYNTTNAKDSVVIKNGQFGNLLYQ